MAKFRFKGFKIFDTQISFNVEEVIGDELEVEFTQSQGVNSEENEFRLTLEVDITDINQSLSISVKMYGYFEFDSDLDEKQLENFFNINAPAILFPYLRSYITSLSALSGISPIILPTLNLSAGAVKKQQD